MLAEMEMECLRIFIYHEPSDRYFVSYTSSFSTFNFSRLIAYWQVPVAMDMSHIDIAISLLLWPCFNHWLHDVERGGGLSEKRSF